MKHILLLSLFFLTLVTCTFAQHKSSSSKKFKGDISLGYSRYFGEPNISNGFLLSLKIAISHQPSAISHQKSGIKNPHQKKALE